MIVPSAEFLPPDERVRDGPTAFASSVAPRPTTVAISCDKSVRTKLPASGVRDGATRVYFNYDPHDLLLHEF